ncbi:MAG: hypothetical protein AAGC63_15645 [Propionicimonas sp.]|nr:hypothetical protein [Propionicimonas sp.]
MGALPVARRAGAVEALRGFELAALPGPAGAHVALVCTACSESLCDAEHGDSLATLALVALGHECDGPAEPEVPMVDPDACCRVDGLPFVRHGRGCERYDGWRE